MSVFDDVVNEVQRAEGKFPEYNSMHEGYAIIAEELDELWDEVKAPSRDYKSAYTEAKHIACTAIRFMKLCQRKDKEIFESNCKRTEADEDNELLETVNANTKHLSCPDGWEPEYQGMHEGYAIIAEELDELWDEVKAPSRDYKSAYTEAKHIACTAIRFMKLCQRKDKEI